MMMVANHCWEEHEWSIKGFNNAPAGAFFRLPDIWKEYLLMSCMFSFRFLAPPRSSTYAQTRRDAFDDFQYLAPTFLQHQSKAYWRPSDEWWLGFVGSQLRWSQKECKVTAYLVENDTAVVTHTDQS
jgi:hypothetical protein